MESNKLAKKIQDWAANLGFTLPDGSVPPASHFAALTATPHRRQLWEALVESVQSRQKVEHMRKQILVATLKEKKKYSKNSNVKQRSDRLDLWHKENICETQVKETRNAVRKIETTIMTKASDSLFEICKLSELEKLFEELTEKSVVLKLLMKRNEKIMEEFERKLLKVKSDSDDSGKKEKTDCIEDKLLNAKECECLVDDSGNCELSCRIEDFCDSGITKQCLWEEMIQCKTVLLENFYKFLLDINTSEQSLLWEKKREIEKKLNTAVTHLKQKTTEKALQMIINSTKGKLLEGEVERLEESLLEELGRAPQDSALNESFSFLFGDTSKCGDESEKTLKNIKNYLNVLELQKYEEFLKEEVHRVEEEVQRSRRKDDWKDSKDGQEGVRLTLKAFDSAFEEINGYKCEEERLEKEIFRRHTEVGSLLRSLKEDVEGKATTAEGAADKVKLTSEKQIDLFLETPIDVFRTFESSSGRVLFEYESSSQLTNYGGDLKQFFSAMLIPPVGDTQEILSEVSKRTRLLGEIRRIISKRQQLAAVQRKIQHQLSSINHDTRFCEKNFTESDGILSNVLRKTEELLREVDHIEKILSNWVEQPYRSMAKETVWGKNLKVAEEKYTKRKNE